MDLVESKTLKSLGGLMPSACLILTEGFVREEWKALCFQSGISLSPQAIQSPIDLAQTLVPESKGRVLDPGGRVELLRVVLRDSGLREALSGLLQHRYRPRFYESLDRALQKGRDCFSDSREANIFREHLRDRRGPSATREDYFELNRLWDALLSIRDLWDEARVYEQATRRLREEGARFPMSRFLLLEHQAPRPRVSAFFEALGIAHEVEKIQPGKRGGGAGQVLGLRHSVAHSLEDAAHHLLDTLVRSGDPSLHPVVIEDRPEVRRTLTRVAAERGLPLMDTRDPTRVPQSEELKSVLLDLEVVGRNFEVESVLAWWGARHPGDGERRKRWLEKGSVRGLEAFSSDPVLFQALRNLRNRYPPRVQLEPLRDAVLESARELGVSAGVVGVLERVFEEWLESLKRIGEDGRKRPLRIWQRDLSDRLRQAPPVVARFKRRTGLRLYRVDQAVSLGLLAGSTVHFFGVSAAFFEPRDEGTEWFSSRDLEVLSRDFGLPSRKEREGERRDSFLAWIRASEECPWFHEFLHDGNGVEQESLELILGRIPAIQREPTLKLPVHPWILPSLTSRLKPPVTEVRIHSDRTEFPISFLNAMGDCPFTAYARHLLDLVDERDPDFDLSGDAHGNLLHTAIELLLSSEGSLTPREAFDQAFARTATPAWLRSERLFRALRTKTTGMLEAFLVSEREYRERSGTRILSQEEAISLTRGGVTFQGRMDRVDEHEDGLVLMDYKTGSSLPSATQTRQTGKGLQLPAYALALRESKGREVISAQYLQIRPRKTQRNLGFLFQRWNKGKKADEVAFPLSTARSNSGSLIPDDPEALWAEMEGRIGDLIARLRAGEFPARPADPEDCQRCRYSGVCGRERAVIG